MEIHKQLRNQDCAWKQKPVSSGESGIHLPRDVFEMLTGIKPPKELEENINKDISFVINKNDFIKALCFIFSNLPLYKTSSQGAKLEYFSNELYLKYLNIITSFFGDKVEKEYRCNIILREDGRVYLNNLNQDKFNIRDFFVEDYMEIVFNKDKTDLVNMTLNTGHVSQVILSNDKICNFAFKCMAYFRDDSALWGNIDKYVDDFNEGDSVKVSGKGFRLTGMFKYVTEEVLITLNSPQRRWYVDPFIVKGKSVYMSTEWYPTKKGSAHLNLDDLNIFISNCFGKQFSIKKHDNLYELIENKIISGYDTQPITDNEEIDIPANKVEQIPFSISQIINFIDETGLLYDASLIKRFAFSLMSKPFLILSGLAGSGKTQLALAFARALVEREEQMCVVSVGADWTNREPLLGFPNALQEGKYELPESGVLQLLIEANKDENKNKPFFLILDEMNMSYVERYFADFLSAMESKEPIALWNTENDVVPKGVKLTPNVFIVGTINVDETTYMFSPKVLDRANVIEFKISENEMDRYLSEMKPVDCKSIAGKAAGMGENFVALALEKNAASDAEKMGDTLKAFFRSLKTVNAEFGYRSASEIFKFMVKAKKNDDTAVKMTDDEILDCCIVQKLLPKLHGSRKKLDLVLQELWKKCFDDSVKKDTLGISRENVKLAKYKNTADKIQRMYEAAYANGFTSFAEA